MITQLAWLELKLLVREPVTVVFALGLPLVLLYVLGSVFGNTVDADVYRGVGAMDYYVPAYLALVVASLTLISLPTHIATYRERGVLRRFRASGLSPWTLLTAEGVVAFGLSLAGGVILLLGAAPAYDFSFPGSPLAVILGFVLVVSAFAAVGVALGAMVPTARAAQAIGIMLWFLLLFLGGAGPPREVLSTTLQRIEDATPLWHAVKVMQDGWLGLDSGLSALVLIAVFVLGLVTTALVFRLE